MTHHPTINEAARILTIASEKTRTTAFNEVTGEGDLRYVMMQTERRSGTVCLTVVWNANTIKDCQPALARFTKELKRLNPNIWHSIWCNCNSNSGNVIFSRGDEKWHRLSGPEFVLEPIAGPNDGNFHFSPKAFRQGNMDGFEAISQHVAQSIPPGSKICELYAGIGTMMRQMIIY
jgi:tRNA/tmRNA/rRNA uracil-C5-methylase (TrmA/RlmC/RlmD family)